MCRGSDSFEFPVEVCIWFRLAEKADSNATRYLRAFCFHDKAPLEESHEEGHFWDFMEADGTRFVHVFPDTAGDIPPPGRRQMPV